MTQDHPITPPPELLQEWCQQGHNCISELDALKELATKAARWGADQELEACVEWLEDADLDDSQKVSWVNLRVARRPKPPSLKEQALAVLDYASNRIDAVHENIIRRALEQLDD